MPRQLRLQYEGAIYHLLSRGDRREDIYREPADRSQFLATLGEACAKTDWQVHAYCLMRNHFHLVIETPRANLVSGMKWLLGTYTMRFNRRHALSGHLFAGRYKSLLVDEKTPDYLRAVCDYVHLNPARAGLVAAGDSLASYPWSSYPSYLQPARRPAWLRCDRLLGEHGLEGTSRSNLRELARRMEARLEEGSLAVEAGIRSGWRFGAEDFLARLLDRVEVKTDERHRAAERSETDEEKAQRIVNAALTRRGWGEAELRARRKSDPDKVAIAWQLRSETAMSLKWIAARLQMGSWTHVSNLLRRKSVKSED